MLSREWLIAFHLRCWIDMAHAFDFRQGLLAEMPLDAVVDCEVDGPGGKVTKDGGAETAIEAADAVVLEDGFESPWGTKGEQDVR